MVLDALSSPHRKSQNPLFQTPSKKSSSSWSILLERHQFLLMTLALLAFLCTIYLYFAVTLGGAAGPCSGMSGAQRDQCQARSSASHRGKLRFF
ncbi:unnamed protein product [Spirodela intermedia]|uniref:Uncharacterized protein n=1 Tax=Spirodela intermedia TaxID=51605 RepID=A0A7I8LB61_SPIIN|nr:unnamed protein product [Spirodela intermedia]